MLIILLNNKTEMKTRKYVKNENNYQKYQFCNACLSQERVLYNLGYFMNVYEMLCQTIDLKIDSSTLLCWECVKVLRNVREFQEKIQKSQLILSALAFDENPLDCLSTLTLSEVVILDNKSDTYENDEEVNLVYFDNIKEETRTSTRKEEFIKEYTQYEEDRVNEGCYREGIADSDYNNLEDTAGLDCSDTNDIVNHDYSDISETTNQDCRDSEEIDNYNKNSLEEKACYGNDIKYTDNKNFEEITNQKYNNSEESNKHDHDYSEHLNQEEKNHFHYVEKEIKNSEQVYDQKYQETNQIELKCHDTKSRKKVKKTKNYPKYRKQRYLMTYQSLKWEEAVNKIKINNEQLNKWLEIERNSEHFKSLKNKCHICLQKLKMDERIDDHKAEWHQFSKLHPYCCDICKCHYSSKHLLTTHIKGHYYIHYCTICEYQCYSRLNMRYHLRKSHRRNVICLECDEQFENTRNFYVHLRHNHRDSKHYLCDKCDRRYSSLTLLDKHISRYHTPQRCEQCQVSFKSFKMFSRHLKLKHTYQPSDESYCEPCNRQFDNLALYKQHLLNGKHSMHPRKQVECPDCKKVYSKKETMLNHYRYVHSNQYKYRCEQCGQPFLNRTRYKNHMSYTHEGLEKPKNKMCSYCGKGFSTNQILNNHLLTHTGEKPHSCPHCSQRFRQITAMKSHVKLLHENENATATQVERFKNVEAVTTYVYYEKLDF